MNLMRLFTRITAVILFSVVLAGGSAGAAEPAPPVQPPADQPLSGSEKLTDGQLGELYQQAVLLTLYGRYDDAEKNCRRILAGRPDQPDAKRLLQEIGTLRRQARGDDPGAQLKQSLSQMIVREMNVRDAEPFAVIEFLQTESKKISPDGSPVNIVWMVPADRPLPRVTMSLHNVPLLDVLKYVTSASGLAYRVDTHAVVVYVPAAPEPRARTETREKHVRPE